MSENRIELPQLIKQVTDQLREARDQAGARGEPVLQLAECELEMSFSVQVEGKTGIKVWVLELGAGRSKSESNTVRLKFTPYGASSMLFLNQALGPGERLGRGPEDEVGARTDA